MVIPPYGFHEGIVRFILLAGVVIALFTCLAGWYLWSTRGYNPTTGMVNRRAFEVWEKSRKIPTKIDLWKADPNLKEGYDVLSRDRGYDFSISLSQDGALTVVHHANGPWAPWTETWTRAPGDRAWRRSE